MWTDLLIVGLIGGIVASDTTAAWQVMICRPIISGPLVGLALGDVQTGLLFGAMMELVWAGVVPIGAAVFPDSNVAVVAATAVAVQLQSREIALPLVLLISFLYVIPVAFVGGRSIVLMRKMNSVLARRAMEHAECGDVQKMALQNWLGVGFAFGRGVLCSGAAFLLGSVILSWVCRLCVGMKGGGYDAGLVPVLALGGAVMLSIFGRKRTLGFLLIGLAMGVALSFI